MAEKVPFGLAGREINVFSFDRDPETHSLVITPNRSYRVFKANDIVVMIDSEVQEVRVFRSLDEYVHYEKWVADGDLDEIDLLIATQETSPFRL
jgi:hypothetical protein